MGDPNAEISTQLDKASIENQPYLFEYIFTFSSSETGKVLRFKLEVSNERGPTMSL